jgi:serine/threonine-protein kinase RsbW
MLTNRLKLKIPSIPENIVVVESFIEQIREIYDLDDNIYGNIIVAVTEAVNNAIVHGNGKSKDKIVKIEVHAMEYEVLFSISDEGHGFNPNNLPDPTAPENLETIGGRGIFLISCLSDWHSYSDDGRVLQMKFRTE